MKRKIIQFANYINRNKNSVITFIIGILSSIGTYYLSSYLNREQISIKSIAITPKPLSLSIEWATAKAIDHAVQSRSEDKLLTNDSYRAIGQDKLIKYLKIFNNTSKTIGTKISMINVALSNIQSIRDTLIDPVRLIAMPTISEIINDFEFNDPTGLVSSEGAAKGKVKKRVLLQSMNASSQEFIKNKQEADSLLVILINGIIDAQEVNKGNFQVECVIFNSGNTQSVVRNKGVLTTGGIKLNLKRVDNDTKPSTEVGSKPTMLNSNYLICEPKSFQVLNLQVDEFNNNKSDIAIVRKSYLNALQNATLLLYDVNDKQIEPYSFLLQPVIESDYNNELSNYITTELADFRKPVYKRRRW